ncbi:MULTISPECIES: helix-turn-helix domain-containing protein [Microvirga]|jgi:transcriptional regulator with XRE-family HTH domain
MTIRGTQCRAARALLGWSQRDLAEAAHVGLRVLMAFENSGKLPKPVVIIAIERTLSDHGIVWTEDTDWVGVKIRRSVLDALPPPESE